MTRFLILLTIGFYLQPSLSWSQTCHPLQVLIDKALENSPTLKSSDLEIQLARNEIQIAKSNWRPQVSAVGRATAGETQFSQVQVDNSLGFRVSQQLFDFGKTSLEKRIAEFSKEEAEARLSVARSEEVHEVSTAYISILEADQTLAIMMNRERYLNEQVKNLEFTLSRGASTLFELAEGQSELASTQAEIATVEAFRANSLSLLVMRDISFQQVCPYNTVETWINSKSNESHLMSRDYEEVLNSPIYKAEVSNYASLKAKEKLSRRSSLPVIQAVGTSSYGYDGLTESWGVRNQIGLEINVPLVTGRRLSTLSDSARLNASAASYKSQDIARVLQQSIFSTTSNVKALKKELKARGAASLAAKQQFSSAQKEYELGARTFSDLIEVRVKRDQAELSATRVQYELLRQKVQLLKLKGRLVTSKNPLEEK